MKLFKNVTFTLIFGASILLTGCGGFSEMFKNTSKIKYTVNPNPMQDNGDSVAINIKASYPAKFFNKNAIVTVTPILKFGDGTTLPLKSVTLVGERASQNGIKINYGSGGNLNYTDKVAYNSKMKIDELYLDATLENKKKNFPPLALANGTITTALLLQKDARPILAKDNFTKTTLEKDTSRIFFVINHSDVRRSQMRSKEMEEFKEFIIKGIKEGYKFDNITLSAYASPDGETAFNSHLADDRGKSSIVAMRGFFRSMKPKKVNTRFGTEKDFYEIGKTGMDWDGFKTLVQHSNIKDKDLILRVLSMYTDHDQRMNEIKSMAVTYTELADRILPKLRRSVMVLNAEKKSRSNEQISQLVFTHPDSLTADEILYAATLTTNIGKKLTIFKTAEKQYPNDWRGFNNAAFEYIMSNESEAAKSDLTHASTLSHLNPIIDNNMGVIALMDGDTKTAADDFKIASAAGPEVSYNLGIIDIYNGDYSDAVNKMGNINSFNTALAFLLNNNVNEAQSTLSNSGDQSPVSYYLKAIIYARSGNKNEMITNLQSAINKDATFKKMAATDCEFIKYKNDKDFQSLTQ